MVKSAVIATLRRSCLIAAALYDTLGIGLDDTYDVADAVGDEDGEALSASAVWGIKNSFMRLTFPTFPAAKRRTARIDCKRAARASALI
jgi:hypothetical protein